MSNPARDFPSDEAPWFDADDTAAEYIASAVVRLLSAQVHRPQTWISTDEAAAIFGVDRETLDKMVAKAPPDLPGAPLDVSHGVRRRWRWDPSRLTVWAAAYQTWKADRERKAKPHPSRRTGSRKKPDPVGGVVDWNAVAKQK